LADIIGSGVVPAVRLTKVFCQAAASRIITNAHRINQGLMPDQRGRGPRAGCAHCLAKRGAARDLPAPAMGHRFESPQLHHEVRATDVNTQGQK
jgi:hypothetical protein